MADALDKSGNCRSCHAPPPLTLPLPPRALAFRNRASHQIRNPIHQAMDLTINILFANNVVKFPFTIGVLRPASCRVHIPRSRRWYLSISSCVAGRASTDTERSFRRLVGRGSSALTNPRCDGLADRREGLGELGVGSR